MEEILIVVVMGVMSEVVWYRFTAGDIFVCLDRVLSDYESWMCYIYLIYVK